MKFVKYLILVFIVVSGIVFLAYRSGINNPVNGNGESKEFIIEKGEGVGVISHKLKEAELITSDLFFRIYVQRSGKQSKIQAGEYRLSSSMSIKEMVEILSRGEAISSEKTIKFIEGWRSGEMAQYLETEGIFQREELLEVVGFPMVDYSIEKKVDKPVDYSKDFDFLKDKPKKYGLEGYLFPDTYRIYENASIDDIVRKMLGNLDKKLTPKMREDIKSQGKSIYEIITMASIIQKEVRSVEDMKLVSGVFWNRIGIGQALESCATLAYILGVDKAQYSQADTEVDSLYNSYKYRDLPPGPIANPGLKAIEAAIYPTESDYLYFLSRSDNGETVFSKTYNEHLRNKAKYIK
jgi:UPF0755 protein